MDLRGSIGKTVDNSEDDQYFSKYFLVISKDATASFLQQDNLLDGKTSNVIVFGQQPL